MAKKKKQKHENMHVLFAILIILFVILLAVFMQNGGFEQAEDEVIQQIEEL